MSFHGAPIPAETAGILSTSSILFAVFAMTMANATTFATIGLFGRSVGLSEFQVGTIFVSSAVLFLVTSARWGRRADRSGRRQVIVVGLASTAISLLLFAGVAHAGSEVAGGLSAFVVPRLGLPPGRLLAVGLTICLAGLVACLLVPSYGWLLSGFGLLGIGFGFAQPGLVAGASLAAGDRQAEAAGILQAAMSAAWIGGVLTGTGIYGLSIAGPLMLAAIAIVAALVVVLVVGRERETGLL